MRLPTHTLAFRPRVQLAHESLRPSRAEIDLDAIVHNLTVLRARLPRNGQVFAVVKADAYGHGVIPVAQRLEDEGVDGFAVALAEEGLELRETGIRAPILILNGVYADSHRDVLEAGLTPVVYDSNQVAAFDRAAPQRRYRVHLKVDTGMSRLGVPLHRLESFLAELARFPRCVVQGLMTHFSSAESDESTTSEQILRFEEARRMVLAAGHRPQILHCANSAAALRRSDAAFDAVRAGGALYGAVPSPSEGDRLRPALRLRTEVIATRDLLADTPVGYDGTFVSSRPMRIATVPIGYGDGLLRELSNRGEMIVRGTRCPIVGRVSMDLTTLDVSAVADVSIGDEVVVLGSQRHGERHASITSEDVARCAGTIPYDVLTSISRRVPRFYRRHASDEPELEMVVAPDANSDSR